MYKATEYSVTGRAAATPGRLGMDKDISMEQKTWQVYNFLGGRGVFRLNFNESREGFCPRARRADGPKLRGTAKVRELTVESLQAESIRSGTESRLREGL